MKPGLRSLFFDGCVVLDLLLLALVVLLARVVLLAELLLDLLPVVQLQVRLLDLRVVLFGLERVILE